MNKLHNYIVLDCETGGLSKKDGLHAIKHPICSIAMLGLNGGSLKEISRYESLIKGRIANGLYIGYSTKHDQQYQPEALKINGLTTDKIEYEGRDSKHVVSELIEFFEKCASESNYYKIIAVGHNVTYDIPFIQYLFSLYNKDLSKWFHGYRDHVGTFHPVYYDTQFLSRSKSIDEELKHNLVDVAVREGFEPHDAHSALNDVIVTADIFKKYILTLRNGGGGEKQVTESFREGFVFEY